MRYYQSPNSYRSNQPKRGLWFRLFGQKKRKIVTPETTRYNNPYLKNKKKSWRIPYTLIGCLLIFFGWVSLIIWLPYFKINNITVQSQKIIKSEEVILLVSDFIEPKYYWPKNNYFLVNQKKIADLLMGKFVLQGVDVQKTFPNTINITLQEKISSIIYDDGHDYYLLDQSGSILRQIAGAGESVAVSTSTSPTSTPEHSPDLVFLKKEYGSYPIIYDLRKNEELDQTSILFPNNFIKGVIEFYNSFKQAKLGTIKYGVLDESGKLTILIDKPWIIYMQPTHDIREQIENLSIITKQSKPTEYIDVRFGERVYWK